MSVLEHLAQAAVVILLTELMIGIIIFLAISGGLAFGLHWVRGKTGPAFTKVNTYVDTGVQYVHRGTGYAALPTIKVGRFASMYKGTIDAIQRQVRRNKARREGLELANEAAKPAPVEQEPDVLV